MKKTICLLYCILLCFAIIPAEVMAEENQDVHYETEQMEAEYQEAAEGNWIRGSLEEAFKKVYEGGTIRMLKDVLIGETVTASKKLTLTSAEGGKYTISSNKQNHSYLLRINGEVTMTNVIVDGGGKEGITASRALIAVGDEENSGKLTLDGNTTICNSNNTTSFGLGGGICVISGELTVNDAQIIGNKAYQGGGIGVFGGSVNINSGAKITENSSETSGGGICVSNGTATMNGGEISDNVSNMKKAGGGGGVYVGKGKFVLKNGQIKDNNTINSNGGGIYNYKGTVEISGGKISGNYAKNVGGAVMVDVSAVLNLMAGTITENYTDNFAGGVECAPSSRVNISGNPVVKNNASTEELDDGIYLDGAKNPSVGFAAVTIGELTEGGEVHFYTWAEEDGFLIASTKEGYHITDNDMEKMSYNNERYYLRLETDNLAQNGEERLVLGIQKEISVTADDVRVTYDGKNVSDDQITGTAECENEMVSGKWSFKGNAPKKVSESGKYMVMFTPDSPAYKKAECEILVTIEKKTITIKAMDKQVCLGEKLPDLTDPFLHRDYEIIGMIDGDQLSDMVKIRMGYNGDSSRSGAYDILIFAEGEDECYSFIMEKGTLMISEETGTDTEPPAMKAQNQIASPADTGDRGNAVGMAFLMLASGMITATTEKKLYKRKMIDQFFPKDH